MFSLVGADVAAWFAQLPRPQRTLPQKRPAAALPLLAAANAAAAAGGGYAQQAPPGVRRGGGASARATIDRFYLSRHCAVCDELTRPNRVLCDACLARPQLAAAVLAARWGRQERHYAQLARVCLHCGGGSGARHGNDGEKLVNGLSRQVPVLALVPHLPPPHPTKHTHILRRHRLRFAGLRRVLREAQGMEGAGGGTHAGAGGHDTP